MDQGEAAGIVVSVIALVNQSELFESIKTYKHTTGKRNVNTEPELYPQFMVYSDEENNVYPMTEENCNVTNWDAEEIADHSIASYFRAMINWIKAFFALLKSKIGNC